MASPEFLKRVQDLVAGIEFRDRYRILVEIDQKDPEGRAYLQLEVDRPDCFTGEMGVGKSGKTYLSEHQTDSEILRKALGLFLAFEEHEVREDFKWNGRAIFGPHIDIQALWDVALKLDIRK